MTAPLDVKISEYKIINGDNWRFDHRENGYIIVSKVIIKNNEASWQPYLHAVSLEACLQYVFTHYDGKCGILEYEELQDV